MTTLLWTAVILMAPSLLAEIFAFIGFVVLTKRKTRRASELTRQISVPTRTFVEVVEESELLVQPRLQVVAENARQIGVLLASRLGTIEAAYWDANRRAERIRLRLHDSVQTVEQHRRGIYHEAVEPIQVAAHAFRGLKIAVWLLRRVA